MSLAARTSIPRLRSVKFKTGGELRVLPTKRRDARRYVEDYVRQVLDAQGTDITGFAFVVWGADLSSSADLASGDGSPIPSILIPDFVRNRLLARKIEDWTREGLGA